MAKYSLACSRSCLCFRCPHFLDAQQQAGTPRVRICMSKASFVFRIKKKPVTVSYLRQNISTVFDTVYIFVSQTTVLILACAKYWQGKAEPCSAWCLLEDRNEICAGCASLDPRGAKTVCVSGGLGSLLLFWPRCRCLCHWKPAERCWRDVCWMCTGNDSELQHDVAVIRK